MYTYIRIYICTYIHIRRRATDLLLSDALLLEEAFVVLDGHGRAACLLRFLVCFRLLLRLVWRERERMRERDAD